MQTVQWESTSEYHEQIQPPVIFVLFTGVPDSKIDIDCTMFSYNNLEGSSCMDHVRDPQPGSQRLLLGDYPTTYPRVHFDPITTDPYSNLSLAADETVELGIWYSSKTSHTTRFKQSHVSNVASY
jgi:hypothetical protein